MPLRDELCAAGLTLSGAAYCWRLPGSDTELAVWVDRDGERIVDAAVRTLPLPGVYATSTVSLPLRSVPGVKNFMQTFMTSTGFAIVDSATGLGKTTAFPSFAAWTAMQGATPSANATYAADQVAWLGKTGVRVGSRVRVTRRATAAEGGWLNLWHTAMDDAIGLDGIVRMVGPSGLTLEICFPPAASHLHTVHFVYPWFVLHPVP